MEYSGAIDYAPLSLELRHYLARRQATYGIYCRELNTGQSFGINEDALFVQASCLKIAYVLYLYEQIATGECMLEYRLSYRKSEDFSDGSGYLQYMAEDGDRFTLRALASAAITLSDNIAYRMIKRFLGPEKVLRHMQLLGAVHPRPNGEHYTTPRDMGCYLRGILDFAAREPELGSRMLEDMTHPVWHNGLPRLLPDSVRVAHKEGDLEGTANDVGIIFLPGHPYLLTILSKEQPDIKTGFREIALLSKIIYDYHKGNLCQAGNTTHA